MEGQERRRDCILAPKRQILKLTLLESVQDSAWNGIGLGSEQNANAAACMYNTSPDAEGLPGRDASPTHRVFARGTPRGYDNTDNGELTAS